MIDTLTQHRVMPGSKIRRPGTGRGPDRLLAFFGRLPGPAPLIADVIRAAASAAGVSMRDLISHRRQLHLTFPRQCAIWVAYHATMRSLPEIGRRFGDRDHTTVLHAVRMTDKRLREGREAAEMITAILEVLAARPRLSIRIDIGQTTALPPPRVRDDEIEDEPALAPRPRVRKVRLPPKREMVPGLREITGEHGSRRWFEENDARFRAGLAHAARRVGV